MKTITLKEAVQKLYDHRKGNTGTAFSVTFVKRTDGALRHMNARYGVTKHLKGGELPYVPKEKDLMGCFDMQTGEYRMINLETIQELKIAGDTFTVKD